MEREANVEKYSNLPGKSIALRCLLETLWFPLSGGLVAGGGGYTRGQRDSQRKLYVNIIRPLVTTSRDVIKKSQKHSAFIINIPQ